MGVLPSKLILFRRVWLLVAIATTVVLGPRLFTEPKAPKPPLEVALAVGHPDLAAASVDPQVAAASDPEAMVVLEGAALEGAVLEGAALEGLPPGGVALTTTSTTDASATTPAPAPSTTTAAVSPSTTSTTAAAAKQAAATTTTTSAPPAKKASASAPPPSTTSPSVASVLDGVPPAPPVDQSDGTQLGDVSWYELEGARPGICAHRILDKGTVVTVTNLATGASVTCTVEDRGPYSGDDKVLDLFRDDFARLAPLEEGVVAARLDW